MNLLTTRLKAHNYFWGYVDMDLNQDQDSKLKSEDTTNPTPFFTYKEHLQADQNLFMRYKELNKYLSTRN